MARTISGGLLIGFKRNSGVAGGIAAPGENGGEKAGRRAIYKAFTSVYKPPLSKTQVKPYPPLGKAVRGPLFA